MSIRETILVCLLLTIMTTPAFTQQESPYYELDPKPYDPAVDVNTDMFMADWRDSQPRAEHGALIVRDIFTKNKGIDPLKPHARGAVLNVFTEYAYATLTAKSSTTPSTLKGSIAIQNTIGVPCVRGQMVKMN